jgi:hypothetical protein
MAGGILLDLICEQANWWTSLDFSNRASYYGFQLKFEGLRSLLYSNIRNGVSTPQTPGLGADALVRYAWF